MDSARSAAYGVSVLLTKGKTAHSSLKETGALAPWFIMEAQPEKVMARGRRMIKRVAFSRMVTAPFVLLSSDQLNNQVYPVSKMLFRFMEPKEPLSWEALKERASDPKIGP